MFKCLKIQLKQCAIIKLMGMWALLPLEVCIPWIEHYETNGVWLGSTVHNFLIYDSSRVGLFHTFRKMVLEVKPQDTIEGAARNAPAVYFYCPKLDTSINAHTAKAIEAR